MMVYTELHEFFTIPALITHYISHKKENPNQNLLDFLVEHCATEKHHHNHSDAHKKLPFKHDKIVHTTFLYLLQKYILVFKPYLTTAKTHLFIIHETHLPNLMLCKGIWQPPKIQLFF